MKHKLKKYISRGLDRRRDINALKKHIRAFRSFTKNMFEAGMNIDNVFEYAMRFMVEGLKCKSAAVFMLDQTNTVLTMQKMVSQGEILQGEETIYLDETNPLKKFLNSRDEFFAVSRISRIIHVALRIGLEPIGLIRIEQGDRMLMPLDKEILLDFIRELTHIMQNIMLFQENQEHMRMLMASSEISSAMLAALRFEEALHQVVQSIIKYLGFDRVRVYLVDHDQASLKGEICGDLGGRIQDLSAEVYPLRKGLNKMTDIVLGGGSDIILDKYREIIVHVPLKVKNQTIGLLVADNLLSRQSVSKTELQTLSSLVSHIGMAVENARLFREIEELSITDGLTKLYQFRYFKHRLSDELNRAERFGNKTILIMLDIDHFKTCNDTYGHLVGDTLLVNVANKTRESIRKIDLPARYGGDEFIVYLPHASEEVAHQVAERIFRSIQECTIEVEDNKMLNVTVTMGVAGYPDDAKDVDTLIKKADEALYWGKTHGRNKLSFYKDISSQ